MGLRSYKARGGPQGDVRAAVGGQAEGQQHGAFVDQKQASVGGLPRRHCWEHLGVGENKRERDPSSGLHPRYSFRDTQVGMMLSPRRPKISAHSPSTEEFLIIRGGHSLPPKNACVLQRPPDIGMWWPQVPGKVRSLRPVLKFRGGAVFSSDFQLLFEDLLPSSSVRRSGSFALSR